VLNQPGKPLDHEVRTEFAQRYGHDFSRVRVHHDAAAEESAHALKARAYAFGTNIVFGHGEYQPGSASGRRLLAHELAHVVQQSTASQEQPNPANLKLGGEDAHEHEADSAASALVSTGLSVPVSSHGEARIQRQFVTPLAAGGGFGGLLERDRQRVFGASRPPGAAAPAAARVCSRDLQGFLGSVGNHAYVDSPPYRYAVITPLCPASKWDNPLTGTTAQKWDNSPDPCGKAPTCVDCEPAPGVTDVRACLRSAFMSYNNPSLYLGVGPNSNTFAGTLARTCCTGITAGIGTLLGNCPGWFDAPAPPRAGATPCPPGPTC
jgi:hypothetical protein